MQHGPGLPTEADAGGAWRREGDRFVVTAARRFDAIAMRVHRDQSPRLTVARDPRAGRPRAMGRPRDRADGGRRALPRRSAGRRTRRAGADVTQRARTPVSTGDKPRGASASPGPGPIPQYDGALAEGIEVVSTEKQAEMIREYDHESNFRTLVGPVGMLVTTHRGDPVRLPHLHGRLRAAGRDQASRVPPRARARPHLPRLSAPAPARRHAARRRAPGAGASSSPRSTSTSRGRWSTGCRRRARSRHAWAFLALIGFVAFISMPFPQFGGYGESPVVGRLAAGRRGGLGVALLHRLLRRHLHRAASARRSRRTT